MKCPYATRSWNFAWNDRASIARLAERAGESLRSAGRSHRATYATSSIGGSESGAKRRYRVRGVTSVEREGGRKELLAMVSRPSSGKSLSGAASVDVRTFTFRRYDKSRDEKGEAVPLSDHEQRILAELEESLSKQDPRFAKSVRETNVYAHGGRRVRWGIAGFIAGLVVLVLFFSRSIAIGLVGVALMFISAIVIERNARLLGRASWQDLTRRAHADDTQPAVGSRTRSIRDWLSRQRHREE